MAKPPKREAKAVKKLIAKAKGQQDAKVVRAELKRLGIKPQGGGRMGGI